MRMTSSNIPLCVDLDGTLIRSDLLLESALLLLRANPLYVFLFGLWLLRGKANLKRQIASRVELDASLLPYDERVVAWLREECGGRRRMTRRAPLGRVTVLDLTRVRAGPTCVKQLSDWGGPDLNEAQREYAASDVRFLHRLREVLMVRLEREQRTDIAQACFDFLPTRARLDLAGWEDRDIFSHD